LNVQGNMLTGSLPSSIATAESLTSLNIGDNAFVGSIPSELFDLPLQDLSLQENKLDGSIPSEVGQATLLTSLRFGPNSFTGEIPTSIDQLSNLEILSFAGISDLTGRLPETYFLNLTNLVEFTLSFTSVAGIIPSDIGRLTSLEILDLSNNALRGPVPSQIGLLFRLGKLFPTRKFVYTVMLVVRTDTYPIS
jgi:Leucine-rich repeat (LRR) protein